MSILSLKTDSYREGLVRSLLWNGFAQTMVFATSIVLAFSFGATVKTDIYFCTIAVLTVVTGFVSAIDSSVLVPESMRLAEQAGRDESVRFLNTFLYLVLIIGCVITAVVAWDVVGVFRLISGFSEESLLTTRTLLRWSVPLFVLQMVVQYQMDILSAYKYFTLPMVFAILNRAMVLAAIPLLGGSMDIASIQVGAVAATALQAVLLFLIMFRGAGWSFGKPAIIEKRIWNNIGFAAAGNVASSASAYVPVLLLSHFPAGILTAMNYAQRLATLPSILLTNQVSMVVGVKLNELFAKDMRNQMDETFRSMAGLLWLALLPATAWVFLYSNEIVTVCFGRGAFDRTSVENTGLFLSCFVLSVPFLGINTIVARTLMAAQKIKESFFYQVGSNALLAILIFVSLRSGGATGYPIAYSAFFCLNALLLFFLFKAVFPQIRYDRMLGDSAVAGIIGIAAGTLVFVIRSLCVPMGALADMLHGAALFTCIAGVVAWAGVRWKKGVIGVALRLSAKPSNL